MPTAGMIGLGAIGRDADPAMDPTERKLRDSVCVLLDKDLDAALELEP